MTFFLLLAFQFALINKFVPSVRLSGCPASFAEKALPILECVFGPPSKGIADHACFTYGHATDSAGMWTRPPCMSGRGASEWRFQLELLPVTGLVGADVERLAHTLSRYISGWCKAV